jgi:hypothetical protein
MPEMRLYALTCVCFLILPAAAQAQEARQLYTLPRVGETIDAQEARYFLLFQDWPRDVYERYQRIAVQVVLLSDGSVRFEWIPGTEGLADIQISGAAAEALNFYLDHFEELRTQASPHALTSHPELPKRLQARTKELFEHSVLMPWWPKWSSLGGEGGGLVEVRLKSGNHVSGRLLDLTNKRIILWKKDSEFSPREMSANLLMLPYEEVDTLVVKRSKESMYGWIGVYAGLAYMNVRMEPGPEEYRYPGYNFLIATLWRSVGIGIGSFAFLFNDEQRYEYIPSQFGVERLDQSQLWESIWRQPGLAPEIFSMLDTTRGERLVRRTEAPPLIEIFEAHRKQPPYGLWVGSEQLEVITTEPSGYRTCGSVGYDFLLSHPGGEAGIGVGTLLSVGNTSYSSAVHAFVRMRFLQFTAGVRGWLQKNSLHESRTSESFRGGSYDETSYHSQHPGVAEHYLYREFGVDFVMREVSVGIHYLQQFTPSVTVRSEWRRAHYIHPEFSGNGETVRSGIRISAWAVSVRIWL